MLADPSVSIDKQLACMRGIRGNRMHPEFAEIQLWDDDSGIDQVLRFAPPSAAPVVAADNQIANKKGNKR